MTLLPSGFSDSLTPDAAREAHLRETMLAVFARHGYGRVAPPLLEFEDSLLAGPGAALNRATFRVMDAVSHRMLGLRTDHTLQIGRIAATRLADAPRPLRLSYAGQVVRAVAETGDPARQRTQVGIELIGSLEADADAEAILLGLEALGELGLKDIAVDLLLPTLVPCLLDTAALPGETRAALRHALDRKDEADVARLAADAGMGAGGGLADTLVALLRASGPAPAALTALAALRLPGAAAADCARLEKTLARLRAAAAPAMEITVDLVESRCFEYQTGLSFSFFARAARAELGRGGRYRTASDEPATGLTFYADALLAVLPPLPVSPRLMVPFGLDAATAAALAAKGHVLVQALGNAPLDEQARAQGCAAFYEKGAVRSL